MGKTRIRKYSTAERVEMLRSEVDRVLRIYAADHKRLREDTRFVSAFAKYLALPWWRRLVTRRPR